MRAKQDDEKIEGGSEDGSEDEQEDALIGGAAFADDAQEEKWDENLAASVAVLLPAINGMFDQQRESIADKLAELNDADLQDSAAEVIAGLLFDPAEWRDPLLQAMVPGLVATVAAGRAAELMFWRASHEREAREEDAASSAVAGEAFNADRDTDAFVADLSATEYWQGIQETTARDVQNTIADTMALEGDDLIDAAVAAGLTAAVAAVAAGAAAADVISKTEIMGERLGGLFLQYQEGSRGEFIAENEAANALNYGHQQGMKELSFAGEMISKQWVDRDDGKVRPSHREVGGTVVGVFDLFNVGVEVAPYPRWHGLSMEERAGCRCRLKAVDSGSGGSEEMIIAEVVE